jgi:hypothetical protein
MLLNYNLYSFFDEMFFFLSFFRIKLNKTTKMKWFYSILGHSLSSFFFVWFSTICFNEF